MIRCRVNLPSTEQIAETCRRLGIRKLAVFGSVLREDFRPDGPTASDLDLLVEFKPDQVVGLIRLAAIERELSQLFGHKVDLRSPADLSRYFRDEVVRSAQVLYAA